MVVGVDETRHDELVARVDHLGPALGRLVFDAPLRLRLGTGRRHGQDRVAVDQDIAQARPVGIASRVVDPAATDQDHAKLR